MPARQLPLRRMAKPSSVVMVEWAREIGLLEASRWGDVQTEVLCAIQLEALGRVGQGSGGYGVWRTTIFGCMLRDGEQNIFVDFSSFAVVEKGAMSDVSPAIALPFIVTCFWGSCVYAYSSSISKLSEHSPLPIFPNLKSPSSLDHMTIQQQHSLSPYLTSSSNVMSGYTARTACR